MGDISIKELKNTASNYHEYMVPALFEPWTDTVLGMAQVQPGSGCCLRYGGFGARSGKTSGRQWICDRRGSESRHAGCCQESFS